MDYQSLVKMAIVMFSTMLVARVALGQKRTAIAECIRECMPICMKLYKSLSISCERACIHGCEQLQGKGSPSNIKDLRDNK
eukprot:XP_015577394.1 uncharacterized protein LOC107261598 [Ricinus communis]